MEYLVLGLLQTQYFCVSLITSVSSRYLTGLRLMPLACSDSVVLYQQEPSCVPPATP